MRFPKLTPLILLCLTTLPAFGQTILPKSFGAWNASTQGSFDPNAATDTGNAADRAQLAAAAAREYGASSGEHATYARAAGSGPLTVTLYRMRDASGAYGEYSYLLAPDLKRADFTDHSFLGADRALILEGNLVIQVSGADTSKSAADIKALVASVATHAETGLLPGLPEHLPVANRIDRTDHYILGPQTLDQFFPVALGSSLGFAYSPEVETAQFHGQGHNLTLLIADFPTPQIAQAQLNSLEKKFNFNGSQSLSGSPALYGARSQTLIAIVAGATSGDEANKLLNQVKAGTVLTWSEPTFQFKEPRIELMIVGAIVGSGTICLFAVVAGLAFGGIRLGVKRLFPGKVFDRTSQVDFLQLGLASKAIKAEDFYGFEGMMTRGVKRDKSVPEKLELRLFK